MVPLWVRRNPLTARSGSPVETAGFACTSSAALPLRRSKVAGLPNSVKASAQFPLQARSRTDLLWMEIARTSGK